MGINYYVRRNACPLCGRSGDELHVGKSSAGWCFSLHTIPEEGINSLEDWKIIFNDNNNAHIEDEYKRMVSVNTMLEIITQRNWVREGELLDGFHKKNHSEPGPNGLIRYKIGGGHCVGHGDETYDLIVGEFS